MSFKRPCRHHLRELLPKQLPAAMRAAIGLHATVCKTSAYPAGWCRCTAMCSGRPPTQRCCVYMWARVSATWAAWLITVHCEHALSIMHTWLVSGKLLGYKAGRVWPRRHPAAGHGACDHGVRSTGLPLAR